MFRVRRAVIPFTNIESPREKNYGFPREKIRNVSRTARARARAVFPCICIEIYTSRTLNKNDVPVRCPFCQIPVADPAPVGATRYARREMVQSVTTLFFRNDEHRSFSSFRECKVFISPGGDNPLLPLVLHARGVNEEREGN